MKSPGDNDSMNTQAPFRRPRHLAGAVGKKLTIVAPVDATGQPVKPDKRIAK